MIKKLMKKTVGLALTLLVLTSVFAFSLPALADPDVWGNDQPGGGAENFMNATTLGNAGTGGLRTMVGNIIRMIIGFLGIIAVVIILIGGFKWMTAGGNEEKVGEAKKLLVAGLIGLVIILLSYAIAAFVLDQIANATTDVT